MRHLTIATSSVIIAAATLAGMALLFAIHYDHIQASKSWRLFMEAHDCKYLGQVPADAVPVTGKTAVVFSATPTKNGYLCNDGVTYWK